MVTWSNVAAIARSCRNSVPSGSHQLDLEAGAVLEVEDRHRLGVQAAGVEGGGIRSRTLGEGQYRWLQRTLEASRARHKFVFIHHLVGGVNPDGRGGAGTGAQRFAPLASLAPGKYRLVVEAAREGGGREVVRVPFEWPAKSAQSLTGKGTSELGTVALNVPAGLPAWPWSASGTKPSSG